MATENTGPGDDMHSTSIWGDFVDSDDEAEVEDASEPPERYEQGLYFPLCIGEVLADRYRVEHKLGHGGFSTVWMAHDLLNHRDVALKIMTAGDSGEREYAIQKEIIRVVEDTSRLLTYQDTFLLPGAPGRHHRVLIFPLKGPDLQTYASSTSVAARRSAAKQLLQAIKSLHDGEIIHRDINSANVMYGLVPFEADTAIAAKYQYLGRPRKIPLPISRPMWKDGQLVMPMDMWSYMCIFSELYLGFPMFGGASHSSALEFMVRTLGPLPLSWKGSYKDDGKHDESWYDQSRVPEPMLALEAKVACTRDNISPSEQQLVLSILRRGLSYAPENRLSAGQLLEDAAFKELMGIYGL